MEKQGEEFRSQFLHNSLSAGIKKMVKKFEGSLSEFSDEISTSGLVVVDFYADWCGPCKFFAPTFEQLSHKYSTVKFLKVNVDETEEVTVHYRIEAMPTFKFFLNGQVVDEAVGANLAEIERKINQHKI